MSYRVLSFGALGGLAAMAALSCTAGDHGDTAATPPSATTQSGNVSCASDPRVTAFASGVTAKSASGRFSAQIVSASPSHPERGAGDAGLNAWTMKFSVDGAPASASAAVTATTLMPDHGHGSPRIPVVTANADGTYTASDLYFFMGGVWQVTFLLDGNEPATFSFCIE